MVKNELCPVTATITVNVKTKGAAEEVVEQLTSGVGALGTVDYTTIEGGFRVHGALVCLGWRDRTRSIGGKPWLPDDKLCLVQRLKYLNLLDNAEFSCPCVREIGTA